jgi:hypothetical protein
LRRGPDADGGDAAPPLSIRWRSSVHTAWLIISLLCALTSIFALMAGQLAAVAGLALGLLGVAVSTALVRRHQVELRIDSMIRVHRRELTFELPLQAAREVKITRPDPPLRGLTRYLLVVEIGGELHRIPFGDHALTGALPYAHAESIAARLGVPLRDPVGELRRASRWRCLRWVGQGEEWRLWLSGGALGLVVVIVVRGVWAALTSIGG